MGKGNKLFVFRQYFSYMFSQAWKKNVTIEKNEMNVITYSYNSMVYETWMHDRITQRMRCEKPLLNTKRILRGGWCPTYNHGGTISVAPKELLEEQRLHDLELRQLRQQTGRTTTSRGFGGRFFGVCGTASLTKVKRLGWFFDANHVMFHDVSACVSWEFDRKLCFFFLPGCWSMQRKWHHNFQSCFLKQQHDCRM